MTAGLRVRDGKILTGQSFKFVFSLSQPSDRHTNTTIITTTTNDTIHV